MRILLNECMPVRLLASPAFAEHHVAHVTRAGLSSAADSELHAAAVAGFDLLISSDRHFRHRPVLAPVASVGVICMRITPNVLEWIQPALERLFEHILPSELIGKRTVLWRDHWQIS